MGNTYKSLGLLAQAEICYAHALSLKPDMAPAHCNLASILRGQGRIVEALSLCEKALLNGFTSAYWHITQLLVDHPIDVINNKIFVYKMMK